MKRSLTLLIVTLQLFGFSQTDQQVIRGKVVNEANQKPIPNATITLLANPSLVTLTDSTGNYSLFAPYNRYQLLVNHPSFKTVSRDNVILVAGKQQIQDFELQERKIALDTINIICENKNVTEIDMLNSQRFAAAFYDPARVANSHAGVINTDDQANNLTVHGTSPNYIQWKMEDVEIVNPNHLENAGTINDRPTLNGGGVCILSAQVLQNSKLQFAPFNALSGNALTGVFDMRLRNGNNEKHEHIIQAGLLGTDISTEGPFSKKNKSSYLFNFRYSTIGVLSLMGVNFGDEKITYGDFSYVMSFPHKRGLIKVFGVIGNSRNVFNGAADSTLAETEKDFKNINYTSLTNVSGVSLVTSLNNSSHIKTVIAYSVKKVDRTSDPVHSHFPILGEDDHFQQQKISTLNYLSNRLGRQFSLKTGVYVNYFINDIHSTLNNATTSRANIEEPLIQPFTSLEGTLFEKLEIQAGLHGFYQQRINYFSLQPRAQVKYHFTEKQSVAFNYGTSAQLQPAQLYIIGDQLNTLLPTLSQAYSLIHRLRIKSAGIKTEIFYQEFQNIPVNSFTGFSAFNHFNEVPPAPLVSGGKGKSYGADLTTDFSFREFYLILSGSLYNSIFYTDNTGEKNGRFNTNYNIVLTAGKEFKLKSDKKFFSLNIRAMNRNGFLEPINTLYTNQFMYQTPLEDYYRFDLRMSYRKNRTNSSYIWALDIQNVTARQNVAYHYFDSFTGKVETKYQLGIIPVLSFKVLF